VVSAHSPPWVNDLPTDWPKQVLHISFLLYITKCFIIIFFI
jgi:hypothetical protein